MHMLPGFGPSVVRFLVSHSSEGTKTGSYLVDDSWTSASCNESPVH